MEFSVVKGMKRWAWLLASHSCHAQNQLSTEKDITGNAMNVLIQTKWTFQNLFDHLMVRKKGYEIHTYTVPTPDK